MERFWNKVAITSLHGCWEWAACKNPAGYGRFKFEGKTYLAHRVARTLTRGSISEGLELDHLCRNRGCVNPLHLEAVSHKENLRRGAGLGGVLHTSKTHCLREHERTPENVDSSGKCKICSVECGKKYRNSHKEETAEYDRRYRNSHKIEKTEYDQIYREKNRESLVAYSKRYYEEHREARKKREQDINYRDS